MKMHPRLCRNPPARPPATLDEAWPLALQHVTVAPCTTVLGGIPLRDLAAHLVALGTWFLHERP